MLVLPPDGRHAMASLIGVGPRPSNPLQKD
jgi:hypothetical protein